MIRDFDCKSWSEVNQILSRLSRKSERFIVGIIPRTPIYSYCAEVPADGVLLRYLFAMHGIMRKVIINVPGLKSDSPLQIRAELVGKISGRYVDAELRKEQTVVDLDLPVEQGDRLVVSTSGVAANVEVAGVFVNKPGEGESMQVLLDAIIGELDARVQSSIEAFLNRPPIEQPEPAQPTRIGPSNELSDEEGGTTGPT